MSVTVRQATADDREAAVRLSLRAFSATPGAPYDPDRPATPDARRLVAEVDGRVVGHLGAWEFGHHLAGRRVAAAGISAVVVAPEVRGRGVGTALLRAGLDAARERSEPLASLFPLARALYRRHGFELAGAHPQATVQLAALDRLPRPADDVEVVPGSASDVDAMAALERRVAAGEHGALDRSGPFARRTLTPGEHDAVVLARRGGELTGYVVYGHAPDPGTDGAFYRLQVHELVATDVDSELALWRVLGSSSTAARVAEVTLAPETPLELWLPERALAARPTTWRWMTRLVDPAAAVAGRGWPGHLRGEVALRLHDPVWPDRDGPWTLSFEGGHGTLQRGGPGSVEVDVGSLASWLTGWASASRLAFHRRLVGAGGRDLALLDEAVAGPVPWVRSFF